MATRDEIDRIRAAVNIVDVVSPYVALKRVGPVWKGLCPFHTEKTPSFQVNPDKGFCYCFGCSKGGDAFKFLELAENLSFAEALERLAQMAGVTLTRGPGDAASLSQRDQVYKALEAATLYYQEQLAAAPAAREYLAARGVAHETIASFRVGYAGESYDGLAQFLRRQRVEPGAAVDAGVLTPSERGSPYDKLRGRIITPILDVHDRPIAFGGRLMENVKDRPKYLNTAETPLFSKGKTIYALSRARKAIADQGFAVVMEGYFDVISAHQANFTNVVATLGTALTPEHADLLSRHARRVLLAFDADNAGYKAAQRASAIFEAKEFEVQVLSMPVGEDPDSLLRAGRTAEFQRAIDDAMPIREFQLRTLLDHYLKQPALSERDKVNVFARHIVPLMRRTPSPIELERYIRMSVPLHPFYDQGAGLTEQQIRQEIAGAAAPALPQRPYGSGRESYSGYSDYKRGGTGGAGGGYGGQGYRRGGYGSPPPMPQPPPRAPQSGLQAAESVLLRALLMTGAEEGAALARRVREWPDVGSLFVTDVGHALATRMLAGDPSAALRAIAAQDDQLTLENGAASPEDADGPAALSGRLAQAAAKLMTASAADGGGDGESGQAPLTDEAVLGAIHRLQRGRDDERRRLLRARVEQGDAAAAQELLEFKQKIDAAERGGDAEVA